MANTRNVNPADVQKSLSGVDFPAGKQDIVNYAKDNRAPKEVIDVLNGLPNREYSNSADVSSELDFDEEE